MRVLVFGTYDARKHPRVGVLAEGLRAGGDTVDECNAPLGLDTAARVAMLRQPWRLPVLVARLLGCWLTLARTARRLPRPDAVIVGYLGHFDVHLARLLFRGVPIVLDHLISASDTARDRGYTGPLKGRLLGRLDRAAVRAADLVLVDTDEHRDRLTPASTARAVVVPVGAPSRYFAAPPQPRPDCPSLRVVFFGLYTPLQGAPTVGSALALLAGEGVEALMIGSGQDLAATRRAAAGAPRVRWRDWVPPEELPGLLASYDVCLGIFGTGPKALRVVPNKVYQGAAAGCAVVTSDTAPQRRMLGDAAVLVPPGDPAALADALRALAHDRNALLERRAAASTLAREQFVPQAVTAPLRERLVPLVD